ncbi:S-adenosyl-L-methionine-dependent methyltransferase [Panus rudis PR-1116 ss-1]|nr:S-adenosyl-L-methionine-dependent methyltransferase [Panus rudis PR-1116 ss-1]
MSEASSELPSSKLGTKEHWDNVYSSELSNFEDIGDEGEIWFGEDSVEKMVDWAVENVPQSSNPLILEVGSGNGSLLFALNEAGYPPERILGVDYSEGAVKLARAIGLSKTAEHEGAHKISFAECDFLKDYPKPLDVDGRNGESQWDLVLDKGTFDAMALMEKDASGRSPADEYPTRVFNVVKPGGHFLIVSCNFTEDELREKFGGAGLQYHSRIEFPSFSFGGKKGNVYSSVAFRKPA